MKKHLFILFTLVQLIAYSQQDIIVSQYMFNGLFLNPAYAGTHPYISSSLLHRTQWMNFPGAPKTALFAVDGGVKDKNMGLGLILANDRIGATEQNDIFANYSYQLKLGKGRLSFGVKAGISNYMFRSSNLTAWDANDEVFAGKRSVWIPKFGSGLYYYAGNWFAGVSIPALIAYDPNHNFSFDVDQAGFIRRHYYLNGGYVFTINDQLKLKPSLLVKYLPAAPLQADFNVNLLYRNQFWIGASYRTGDAVTFLAEYQTNFRFRIGYAYDLTTSKLRNYSAGTHEIMIGYDFGKNVKKDKPTRFF